MVKKVTKDMSIGQILQMDQRTAPVFMEFGMQCLGCPMATSESLEMACATHGVSADELVEKLNTFFEENTI